MSIISGADLGEYMNVPDTADNALLDRAAEASSRAICQYCDRNFDKTAIVSASARVFRPAELTSITVDEFWETTALAVKLDDADAGTYTTTITLNTDFILEPLNGLRSGETWPYDTIVLLNRSFPVYNRRPSVQVTAAWGWTAIPDGVTTAALIKGHKLANRASSPEGVLGGFGDFGAVRISRFEDRDIVDLLTPYRRDPILVA